MSLLLTFKTNLGKEVSMLSRLSAHIVVEHGILKKTLLFPKLILLKKEAFSH